MLPGPYELVHQIRFLATAPAFLPRTEELHIFGRNNLQVKYLPPPILKLNHYGLKVHRLLYERLKALPVKLQ
jgi:hypothetical protein